MRFIAAPMARRFVGVRSSFIHRLAGWSPSSVTVLAYNNRAAAELKSRTSDLPGAQVRTLHSLGYKILEREKWVVPVSREEKAQEVKKFRVPLGHGIAGLVAVSGQPIAIADAGSDPRLALDIAESVGFVPESILCVPLFYGDHIIGVLELLDKQGASSFSTMDMDTIGLFANQAAVAIEQSRTHRNLAALIAEVLESLSAMPDDQRQGLRQRARAFAEHMEEDAHYRHSLALAQLVQEIAGEGENEFKACQTILHGFADYLQSRPKQLGERGAI
jgi:GAF domain-containing protein